MFLYLVQHAEALSTEADPVRPLSAKGRSDAKRMGEYLRLHAKLVIPEVLHSGRERAAQTAEILSRSLNSSVSPTTNLKPSDDPECWAGQLKTRNKDVMLVGHLPHLQRLAGLLLGHDDALSVLKFRNGGVVCLHRDEAREWSIHWVLPPALLPAAKKSRG